MSAAKAPEGNADSGLAIAGRAFGRFFWTYHDGVGRLTAANFLSGLAAMAPAALAGGGGGWAWAALGISGALTAVIMAAMGALALDLRRQGDPGLGDFWLAARRLALASLGAHALLGACGVALIVNFRFWIAPPLYAEALKWPGRAVAGLCVWGALFLAMVWVLLPAAMADKGGRSAFAAIKLAAAMALDNALAAALAAGFCGAIIVLGIRYYFGPLLFCFAVPAAMSAALYTTIEGKWERQRRSGEPRAAGGEISAELDARRPKTDIDGEPIRSLRELWRPWDSE